MKSIKYSPQVFFANTYKICYFIALLSGILLFMVFISDYCWHRQILLISIGLSSVKNLYDILLILIIYLLILLSFSWKLITSSANNRSFITSFSILSLLYFFLFPYIIGEDLEFNTVVQQ